jgi:hypothetical protein
MNTSKPKLGPLLPKTPSEPFLVKITKQWHNQQPIEAQMGNDNPVDASSTKAFRRVCALLNGFIFKVV